MRTATCVRLPARRLAARACVFCPPPPPNASCYGQQPYIYAVINWGSKAGAASAGLLTGIIVFIVVPLLGLLAYWLVFLRRTRLAREPTEQGEPAQGAP